MSLILEALKKAQKIRIGGKDRTFFSNLPWVPRWQKKRFFSPKFLLLLAAAIAIPTLIAHYRFSLPLPPKTASPPPQAVKVNVPDAPTPQLVLREVNTDSLAEAPAPVKKKKEASPPTLKPPEKETRVAKATPPSAPPASAPAKVKEAKAIPTPPLEAPKPPLPPEKKDQEKPPGIQPLPTTESANHFNLGLLYQKNNKLQEAMEEYKKAIHIDPMNVEAYNNLGIIYKDLGRREEAISHYQKALSIDPKYGKARHNLGVTLYLQGELEKAAMELNLAIELNPKNPESYNNLGLLYKKQKQLTMAREIMQKGLSLSPNYSPLHYNLALTLEEERDLDRAIFHYRKFLELSKESRGELTAKIKKHLEHLSSHGR